MVKSQYKIRNMTRQELDIAINWAAKEGWNPGLYDADCFYNTDTKGFFMGFLDDEPISCISAVNYNQDFGFLGLYIVKPEYRGKDYGLKIWNHALEYLKTQNIGLDGVVAQQENYKKSGFKLAYRNVRFQGRSKKKTGVFRTLPLSTIPFNEILDYDSKLFPTPRSNFLKCWISQPESNSLGIIKNGKLSGFGVIRKCRRGYKIGPLFADDENTAEQLFLALNNLPKIDSDIFLDVPEPNKSALKLVNHHNMKVVFETARMYTKETPKLSLNKVFGVTSFELG